MECLVDQRDGACPFSRRPRTGGTGRSVSSFGDSFLLSSSLTDESEIRCISHLYCRRYLVVPVLMFLTLYVGGLVAQTSVT